MTVEVLEEQEQQQEEQQKERESRCSSLLKWRKEYCVPPASAVADRGDDHDHDHDSDRPPLKMLPPTVSAKRRRRPRKRDNSIKNENNPFERLDDDLLSRIWGFLTLSVSAVTKNPHVHRGAMMRNNHLTRVATARRLHVTLTSVSKRWRNAVNNRIGVVFGRVNAFLVNLPEREARECVRWLIRHKVDLYALTYPKDATYTDELVGELMGLCGR